MKGAPPNSYKPKANTMGSLPRRARAPFPLLKANSCKLKAKQQLSQKILLAEAGKYGIVNFSVDYDKEIWK